MTHPQPKETWPKRVWIDDDGDNGIFVFTGSPANLHGEEYLSLAEHEALILEEREEAYAVGRAEAFAEAAEIVERARAIKTDICQRLSEMTAPQRDGGEK